jgi:hypothetical protein
MEAPPLGGAVPRCAAGLIRIGVRSVRIVKSHITSYSYGDAFATGKFPWELAVAEIFRAAKQFACPLSAVTWPWKAKTTIAAPAQPLYASRKLPPTDSPGANCRVQRARWRSLELGMRRPSRYLATVRRAT